MQLDLHICKTLQSGKRRFDMDVRIQSQSQRVVIYGPSGAGKSLILKAMAGLLQPDRGHIRLNGHMLFDHAAGINVAPQERQVGYLFQDYALFPHLTVRQNIAFGLSRGWFNPRARVQADAVDYWLDAFELSGLAHQLPEELSGGQRQRTALARALVTQPRALLLDEPFAALDQDLRATLRQELLDVQQRLNVPLVLITHDPQDVVIFGEHVVRLHNGAVRGDLPPDNQASPCLEACL